MSYSRVIPRDLFNESMLLKCIGRLTLLIHDGGIQGLGFEHDGESFDVVQDESDGSISVSTVRFFIPGYQPDGSYKRELHLATPLNSRQAWPLWLDLDGESYRVFDSEGNPTREFLDAIA
jgi:hypothetical protein